MERSVEKNESLAQIKDITAGCIAGAVAKIIEYPFDTLKVLCQINTVNIQSQSTLSITRNVLKEGIFRIYRGLSAPLIGSCGENLIVFWLLGSSERFLRKYITNNEPISLLQIGVCGAFAGFGNTFWITPIEFVKCQMQASNTALMYNNSTLNCFMYNMKTNPLHLWNKNALIATAGREIPGSFIWYTGYRATTRILSHFFVVADDDENQNPNDEEIASWIVLSGGAMAGISYWTAMYPIDLIKSLIQTEEVNMNSAVNKLSVWKLFQSRYQRYGFFSLYNGFSVTVPRAILSNAAIFLTYEYCRRYLDATHFDLYTDAKDTMTTI